MSANAQQETIWLGDLPVATLQNGTLYIIYPDHPSPTYIELTVKSSMGGK